MRNLLLLRAEAETLASELPTLDSLRAQRTTAQAGAAPRQRPGHGEDFWQYRGQTPEDSANAIDWRRSATGYDLYIREHELQSARLMEVWIDPGIGFDWAGSDMRLSKADEARIMACALASRFCESGDMTAVLGGRKGPSTSSHVTENLLEDFDLAQSGPSFPLPRRDTASVVLASDFYGPLDQVSHWVRQTSAQGIGGILLQICDPVEISFPFSGRMKFRQPGSLTERIFGRTEGLKDDYLKRFKARQTALKTLAGSVGWQYETYETGTPRRQIAYRLLQHIAMLGAA